ncbi:3-deoxy-D-manno-octulosonic acid transferase [Balneatrix alpica]|uniref:3-deoxy-D-manno-octulosonic acid transferase n=1 Tax=Balneatrix alpica TaxID=75684 RepID=A0ABV5ZFY6_9GAMM|nr:3-deoxy-D-manno-octulosonic acid transferase [Balneatrix alpica]
MSEAGRIRPWLVEWRGFFRLGISMARLLYLLVFSLALPFLLLRLYWRGRRQPAYRQHWRERLGCLSAKQRQALPRQALLIHACSVGETQAASVLVGWLRQQHPELPLILTHTTPTGRARGQALMADVPQLYLPFDLPWLLGPWLRQLAPRGLVLMETEVWPELVRLCRQQGLPVSLANARLSPRSFAGYQRVQALLAPVWASLSWVGAQYPADAQRLQQLGVPGEVIQVVGNLKLAMPVAEGLIERAQAWRAAHLPARACWLAASTHEGEEQPLLALQQQWQAEGQTALLLLAPRHPERVAQIIGYAQAAGLRYARRSVEQQPAADTQVFIIDTLGELQFFYALADACFVGGSLIAHGGHNPFEPVQVGRLALCGPHMFNFQALTDELAAQGALVQCASVTELAAMLRQQLSQPSRIQLTQLGQVAAPQVWVDAILSAD